MNNCSHTNIIFLGIQKGIESVPNVNDFAIWNCVECDSTISINNEDYVFRKGDNGLEGKLK